jgi:benzoyl-CoA reductase subunit B
MAADTHRDSTLIGRSNREGARLFREWFAGLTQAAAEKRGAAYVFVMGSLAELLRTFDLPLVFPEINSLQTAVRHVAHEYLDEAEDQGYSPDICGYVKADVATQMRSGVLPMGTIPKPAIALCTNACNTYIKWGEIWERMYGVPVVTLDVPGNRGMGASAGPGDPTFANDRRYVAAQIKEIIPLLERVSGVRFDIDRLRANMAYANTMNRCWKQALLLNRSRPAPFNALSDGTIFLGVANAQRGTAEGARYFTELVEEMEYKNAAGIGAVSEERHRLVFVGVPCYPIFRRFTEMFAECGGAFVNSTYLWFASGGANTGFECRLDDPLEGLAEGLLVGVRDALDSMYRRPEFVPRIGHDGSARGLGSPAEEPDRCLLRGADDAPAAGRARHGPCQSKELIHGLCRRCRRRIDADEVGDHRRRPAHRRQGADRHRCQCPSSS